jgi:hypothetical protein
MYHVIEITILGLAALRSKRTGALSKLYYLLRSRVAVLYTIEYKFIECTSKAL